MILSKNKKIILVFISLFCFLAILFFFIKKEEKMVGFGVISDIHAGKEEKIKREKDNIIYPRKYKECLRDEIKKFKEKGIKFAIALGDSINKSQMEYFESLEEIAKDENFEIIWVKGNHDRNLFKEMGIGFYFKDRGQYRIIVLDSTGDVRDGDGKLNEEQLNFLRDAIQTKKEIIVVMHHPPFKLLEPEKVLNQYQEFFNIVKGKARYVLSGHWHKNFLREEAGTKFIVQEELSQENGCTSLVLE